MGDSSPSTMQPTIFTQTLAELKLKLAKIIQINCWNLNSLSKKKNKLIWSYK